MINKLNVRITSCSVVCLHVYKYTCTS